MPNLSGTATEKEKNQNQNQKTTLANLQTKETKLWKQPALNTQSCGGV